MYWFLGTVVGLICIFILLHSNIAIKIPTFLQSLEIISQVLKRSKVQKKTRLRIYNTLSAPTLLRGSETSTLKE